MIAQEDTVKAGAREQYESGRKQLAAWHASIKDPHALVVFEVRTGENKGDLCSRAPRIAVGRFG